MIKQAPTVSAPTLIAIANLNQLIAELEGENKVAASNPKGLKDVLAGIKDSLSVGSVSLSDAEQAEVYVTSIAAASDQLEYARTLFKQSFFANYLIPHSVRYAVATFLWNLFGVRGNPIWKNYVDGTFRYIDPTQLEDE